MMATNYLRPLFELMHKDILNNDIVLMDDDPSKIALARKISVHTLKIVKENIWFGI